MTGSAEDSQSPGADGESAQAPGNASMPKPKRLACMICRKRKLRCDGARPSCSTCSRLGHKCAYDEQRRKSGPKRGYVKALEERLRQVETLLKTQEPTAAGAIPARSAPVRSIKAPVATAPTSYGLQSHSLGIASDERWQPHNGDSPQNRTAEDFNFNSAMRMPADGPDEAGGDFPWEMIGLGLEEPLPPQETIDELHQIFFEQVHPSIPMIHRYRYLAAMNLPPNQRPPVCLRYAMWTLACSVTAKFSDMKDLFYTRARKYVEADYIKGFGEHMITLAHCQAHALLANYEIKMMYFPRAWMSTGNAVRLAQMLGLHRLDGVGLDVKQTVPSPKDWTEKEERRRTFWTAFCEDRYASIGTGWPMTIDEADVLTHLPSSEEAFDLSRAEPTQSLADSATPQGVKKLSPFGSVVLLSSLFGRNLIHLHRPDPDDCDGDVNGPFWKRHRQMDNIILNTSLGLPDHLKLPRGMGNPNVIFANMSIHAATICLHQAAIFKAEKSKLTSLSGESKVRCVTAANEVAKIMRQVSHMDLASMNPFISFCLYVAARVFVQYLKSLPEDSQVTDTLHFLLTAMNALKRRNPLTESFLAQLQVDYEALAQRNPNLRAAFPETSSSPRGNSGPGEEKTAVCDSAGRCGIMAHGDRLGYVEGADESMRETPNLPGQQGQGKRTAVANGHSTRFTDLGWVPMDQAGPITGLNASSGSPYDKNFPSHRHMAGFTERGEASDASPAPDAGLSSRPTPTSTTASATEPHPPPGLSMLNGVGSRSFGTSPVSPQQSGMMGQGFFGHTDGFVMSAGLGTQHAGLNVGGGWSLQQGQAGLQPSADVNMAPGVDNGADVMRALMNMGPMDAMDLSTWDHSQ